MAEPAVIDQWDGGVGWIADPDEAQERTSHALVDDGEIWLVDPVDFDGLDALIADRGEVRGILLLLDRHRRDCATLANRYGVPVLLPGPLGTIADEIDAATEPITGALAETGYRFLPVIDNRYWREVAVFDGMTLIVPEAVGTGRFFTVGAEPLGVHPMLRLTPPHGQLGGLAPERVLVGHGEGIMTDGARALGRALDRSRRTAPRLFGKLLRMLLTGG